MLVLLEQRKCMLFALTLEQQSTDKSWAAPEMSWGNLEETPSQGAQGTDFIRPLLYGAALKKIDYAFPGKKNIAERKVVWQSRSGHPAWLLCSAESTAWSSLPHVPLGRAFAGVNIIRQYSAGTTAGMTKIKKKKSVLCFLLAFGAHQGVFAGAVWACDLLGLGRQHQGQWGWTGSDAQLLQQWKQLPALQARCCPDCQHATLNERNNNFLSGWQKIRGIGQGSTGWEHAKAVLISDLRANTLGAKCRKSWVQGCPECSFHSTGKGFICWWLHLMAKKCEGKGLFLQVISK